MTSPLSRTSTLGRTVDVITDSRSWSGRSLGIAAVAGAAVVVGVALAAGIGRVGPLLTVVPLLAIVAWYLSSRPGVAFGALVGTCVLFEDGDALFGLTTDFWYRYLGGTPLQVADFLLGCTLLAVLVSMSEGGAAETPRFRLAGSFTAPLLLLAVAIGAGVITGYTGEADPIALLTTARNLAYLVLVPFVGVAVLTDAGGRRAAVGVVAGLVIAKAAFGIAAYLAGQALEYGEAGQLIYYEAPMNLLAMLYLIATVIALVAKAPIPRWILVGWPIVFICFGLSLRRSFWIAALLALALALIVATGQRGRPWVLLGGVALAVALWATVYGGGATGSSNPIVERAQSLDPREVRQSSDDRYRLDEQQSVIEEIRRRPLTGLGLGVPWTARAPLSQENPSGRFYTHVTVLWYWMNTGPLGLAAYLWLTGTTIWVGIRLWRRSNLSWERAVALALAVCTVGLAIAETTGSFTGISFRFTVILGAALGWLASAQLDLRPGGSNPLEDGDQELALPALPDRVTSA